MPEGGVEFKGVAVGFYTSVRTWRNCQLVILNAMCGDVIMQAEMQAEMHDTTRTRCLFFFALKLMDAWTCK